MWDMNLQLLPCPICGKAPKVKRDYAYEASGFGAWCIIQCKPFLRRTHMKVQVGKASWDRAYLMAATQWNEKATEI